MPTTIVAGDTLAKGQVTTLFDTQVIPGIPWWVIIAAFLFLILMVVNLYWLFRMKKLASVRGYADIMKKATQEDVMVFIISNVRNLTIECLRKRDTAISFYNKARLSIWIHNSPISVFHIGGKGGIFLTEEYYRSRDMVSEIALCHACDEYNSNLVQYKEMFSDKIAPPIKDYNDYIRFGRKLLEYLNPDGLRIPVYNIFNPEAFRKYFPKGMTAMANGAVLYQEARELKIMMKAKTFWEKYLPLGMFMTIGIIVIIAAWMVPLGK
jgi:hypothetical protein